MEVLQEAIKGRCYNFHDYTKTYISRFMVHALFPIPNVTPFVVYPTGTSIRKQLLRKNILGLDLDTRRLSQAGV